MKPLKIALLVAAGAWAGAGAAWAQSMDVRQEIDAEVQEVFKYNTGPLSYKFDEYKAVPNGFFVNRYTLEADTETYGVSVDMKHIGLSDQSYNLEGGRPGSFTYSLGWDQTPHVYSHNAETLYETDGANTFRLGNGLQADMQNDAGRYVAVSSGMASFLGGAHVTPLGESNDTAKLNLAFLPAQDLKITLDAADRHTYGSKAQGTTFGFSNVIELPQQLDYNTYNAGIGAEWAKKDYQMNFHYGLSSFQDQIGALIWDNPLRLTDRASTSADGKEGSQGQMATPPSSLEHSFAYSLNINLPHRTNFSADLGYSVWKQDDAFLPYTINSAINPTATAAVPSIKSYNIAPFDASQTANLPQSNADMLMKVFNQSYRLSSNLGAGFRGSVAWKDYKIEDHSTQLTFPGYVELDSLWVGTAPIVNELQNYERKNMDARLDYDTPWPLSFALGYGREWLDRDREVTRTAENVYKLSAIWRPSHRFFVNGMYSWANRRMDSFDLTSYQNSFGSLTETPGLRRFDVSDRDRQQGRLQATYAIGDAAVSLSLRELKDNYLPGLGDLTGGISTNENLMYGVQNQKNYAGGTDVSLPLGGNWSTAFYYEYDYTELSLLSNNNGSAALSQDPANDWTMRSIERSQVGGVTLTWAPTAKLRASVGVNYVYSTFNTDPVTQGSALHLASLPEVKRITQDYTATAAYKLSDSVKLSLRYMLERFDNNDYATGSVPLITSDAIYLGDSVPGYIVHVASLGVSYVF